MKMSLFESAVMVVDDSLIDLVATASQIQRVTEWEVIQVGNPLDALKILGERSIPLVIADINMPEMDGIELLQKIFSLKKGIQVIVITSGTSVANCISCFRYGATDFLSKPLEKADFQEVFSNVLSRLKRWEKLVSVGRKKGGTS